MATKNFTFEKVEKILLNVVNNEELTTADELKKLLIKEIQVCLPKNYTKAPLRLKVQKEASPKHKVEGLTKPIRPEVAWMSKQFNGKKENGKGISLAQRREKFNEWISDPKNKEEFENTYVKEYNVAFAEYVHRQQTESEYRNDPEYYLDIETGEYNKVKNRNKKKTGSAYKETSKETSEGTSEEVSEEVSEVVNEKAIETKVKKSKGKAVAADTIINTSLSNEEEIAKKVKNESKNGINLEEIEEN